MKKLLVLFFSFAIILVLTNQVEAQLGGGGTGGGTTCNGSGVCCSGGSILPGPGGTCITCGGCGDGINYLGGCRTVPCPPSPSGGGGGGGGAPACRALNQSCNPPGGKGGQGNCCSGLNCKPDGKGGGTCKYNGCGAAGKTGDDYNDGCCAGLSPDGKGSCACSTPTTPSSLTPNNTAVCPGTTSLNWGPAGKTYIVDVDSNADSSNPDCNSPAAKDHSGDECVQTTERPWSYTTTAGSSVAWSVNTVNTASGCNQPSGKSQASFTVSSQPTAPTNVRPNGMISPGTQAIRWNAPSNADSNTRYHVRIDNTQNGWNGSCSSPNAGDSCVNNLTATQTNYNFQGGNAYNLWVTATSCSFASVSSAVVTATVPNAYPTVAVQGKLREYTALACQDNISTNTLSLGLTPQSSTGVTTNCGITPAVGTDSASKASYRCTATFDVFASADPTQNMTISATSPDYQPGTLATANACTVGGSNTVAVDVAASTPVNVFDRDLIFRPIGPYVKIRDGAFASRNNTSNVIPASVIAYDGDDTASRNFIIGAGVGSAVAPTLNFGTGTVSTEGWEASNYTKLSSLTPSIYLEYVKARKDFKNITQSNLSELEDGKIHIWTGSGDLTINDANKAQFNGKRAVLVSEGTINFENDFTPSSASAAIVADTISFTGDPTPVETVEGLFVANTIRTGETADQGLKVIGNLVAGALANDRYWAGNNRPTVFVVLDPSLFIDLLPWASVSKYEYRQTQ